MNTILVTGFEPFGGLDRNPSQEVIAELPTALDSGCRIITRLLPVDVDLAPGLAVAEADDGEVDAVVCLGLAVGSTAIRIERIFANLYEHGQTSSPLVVGAADGLFSSLPIRELAARAAAVDVPVDLSMTAGLYVCNALGYALRQARPRLPSGFIHLPMTRGTDAPAGLPLETAVRGVTAMVETVDAWVSRGR